jgi:hypothetical protein
MRRLIFILILTVCTTAVAKIINIPADFETIQEGIDASIDGDTVVVAQGKYYETLSVEKGIVLASQYIFNPDTSIISQTVICGDSSSSSLPILLSVTISETQVTISGFTFTHNDDQPSNEYTKIVITGYDSPGILFTDSKIINNVSDGPYIFLCDAPVQMKNVYFVNNSLVRNNDYLRTPLISCYNRVKMENVKILNNTFHGINIVGDGYTKTRVELNNVTITGNNGYGILVNYAKSFFADNIKILNNGFEGIKLSNMQDSVSIKNSEIAFNNNGGLAANIGLMKYFYLEGTSIHNNRAPYGGGLSLGGFSNDIFHMNEENRCSIYNNDANVGSDIFLSHGNSQSVNISIPLDTFTIANPSWFHAYYQFCSDQTSLDSDPIQIDFQHSIISTMASDLYVSPEGNDKNSGTNPANPLKTISQALRTIEVDSLHTRNIYLAEGIYSPTNNGEKFPIYPRDYVSLIGAGSPDAVILDAEKQDRVFYLKNVNVYLKTISYVGDDGRIRYKNVLVAKKQAIELKNMTITGSGKIYYNDDNSRGGGVFFDTGANALMERCIIANTTGSSGGGIGIYNARPHIVNCSFYNNIINHNGRQYLSDISYTNQFEDDTVFVVNSIFHRIAPGDLTDGDGARIINCITGGDSVFIDPENGNYNLSEGSPLIDAGLTLYVHEGDTILNYKTSDYAGEAPDIGAMEVGYDYTGLNTKSKINIADKFELYQNYPNPFNASTTVSFNLEKPGITTIKIYNILGRLVDTIKLNKLNAGYHQIKYDASSLSSGVYFYKINTGNDFNFTKKMILIK